MSQTANLSSHDTCQGCFKKYAKASLLPYHLGRMTTYMCLGAIAALLSRQIIGNDIERWMSIIFLSLAGCIFISSALPPTKFKLLKLRLRGASYLGTIIGKCARLFYGKSDTTSQYVLGMLLGLLPCGLVFAALMVVSTTGNPLTAALAMALFTLGTFPILLLIGLGGRLATYRWPHTTHMIAKGAMMFNGLSLFLLAGTMF